MNISASPGSMPDRIFVDSCVLQLLSTYGEYVYDGGPLRSNDRIHTVPDGLRNLHALRELALVGQRASLDWVVSEASIREALLKRDASHSRWVFEMMDYAGWCLDSYPRTMVTRNSLRGSQFGYLSAGDRQLLEDALQLGCGGFLTIDRRLHRNAVHIRQAAGIRIIIPSEYLSELRPWMMLFY